MEVCHQWMIDLRTVPDPDKTKQGAGPAMQQKATIVERAIIPSRTIRRQTF